MSNINPNNIDGTYPIAGQDNDSQGFRDNFTNIKNNLSFAKSELEDLAGKVLLKSPLIGTVLSNEMNDAPISGAKIRDFSETVVDHGTVTGMVTMDHTAGHYHTMTLSSDVLLNFTNWPLTGALGRIRVAITVPSNQFSLFLPATVVTGLSSIAGVAGDKIQFGAPDTVIYEFTTSDGGMTIAINDLSRPRLSESLNNSTALQQDVVVSSAVPVNTGLSFDTVAATRYTFSALIPFQPNTNGPNSVVFTIGYAGGGSSVCSIETQESTQFKAWTIAASDDVSAASSQPGTALAMCRINGVFTSGSAGTVHLRAATFNRSWTIKAGATLTSTLVGAVA